MTQTRGHGARFRNADLTAGREANRRAFRTPGAAGSGARRVGASSLRPLGLAFVVAALLLALTTGSASAAKVHPFERQITGTCPAAGTCTPAEEIPFANPFGLTVNAADSLFVADAHLGGTVDKFSPAGVYEAQTTAPPWDGRYNESLAFSAGAGEVFVSDSNEDDLWGLDPATAAYTAKDLKPLGNTTCCRIHVAADNSSSEAAGDLYVSSREATPKVIRITSTGAAAPFSESASYISGAENNELTGTPDTSFAEPHAVAVAPSGRLFVADGRSVYEYEPSGEFVREISAAAGTPLGLISALAVDPTTGNPLVAEGPGFGEANTILELTPAGALLARITKAAGGNFESIQGLATDSAGRLYVADSSNSSAHHVVDVFGPLTNLPVETDGGSVTAVSAESATLRATISPNGTPTSYAFEFGTAPCSSSPAACTEVPSPSAQVGAGEAPVAVSQPLRGLTPSTTYYFRLIATDQETATQIVGPDRSFTTQGFGAFALPDARQWQLVSPPDKGGGVIGRIGPGGMIQAAASGGAITYLSNAPTEAGAQGAVGDVQILSSRSADGWSTRDIAPPHRSAAGVTPAAGDEYRFFTPELSSALIQPFGTFEPALSPEATEQSPYLRTLGSCSTSCYRPLVTAANVMPAGTPFGEERPCEEENGVGAAASSVCGPHFLGSTGDLSHVVFSSEAPLTADAGGARNQLYEWSGGALSLVSLLPENGSGEELPSTLETAFLGNKFTALKGSAPRAISADGSRVFWSEGEASKRLFVRDLAAGESLQLDAADPTCLVGCESGGGQFQIASTDGSRVFFTDEHRLTEDSGASEHEPDLYECRLVEGPGGLACDLTDLTPGTGGEPANVQGSVGASADGSSLYFVADGVLAHNTVENGAGPEEAEPGTCENILGEQAPGATCNLYLLSNGSTRFVATLSGEDGTLWSPENFSGQPTRVSPDGEWLAFMSARPLTGYDNRDASSGRPDAEVYRYGAASGHLTCASCDPTGARPVGVEFGTLSNAAAEGLVGRIEWGAGSWVAAVLPAAPSFQGQASAYQNHYLSASGRLFFNAYGPLASQDNNGNFDVYENEPTGVGNCTPAAAGYDPGTADCLGLISSGTSTKESAFLDASESGADVFFLSASRLAPQDIDTARDVYDAAECGTSPCFPEPAALPPACEGQQCQQPPAPAAEAAPATPGFSGAGNVLECRKGQVKKSGKCVKKKQPKKHHKKKHPKKKNKGKKPQSGKKK
jgi:hypothetical protein